MPRETALRLAFRSAVDSVLASSRAVAQPRLVKLVVRVYERGAGLRGKR